MIFNPQLPPKDGYTLSEDWLDGEHRYVLNGAVTRKEIGSYKGNSIVPSILLPFSPTKLIIRSQKYGVALYWHEGMQNAPVMGGSGSGYVYVGDAAVTLTQSGGNTKVSFDADKILLLQESSYPLGVSSIKNVLGISGVYYDYEAWGVMTE